MDEVRKTTGWTEERAKRALDLLLSKGMAWLDVHQGNELYWFPSVWRESAESADNTDETGAEY